MGNKSNKKDSYRYTALYMSLGMCFGMCVGAALGMGLYKNYIVGMIIGLAVGLILGLSYGSMLDKNVLIVKDIIEDDFGCEGIPDDEEPTVTVVLTDKNGKEQQLRIADKLCYDNEIKVGDKVLIEKDGSLIRLNRKYFKRKK